MKHSPLAGLLATVIVVIVVLSWIIYVNTAPANTVSNVELLVYTPPTIQPILSMAADTYTSMYPNVKLNIITGATGTILSKIKLTGEGDILITADHEYMLNASKSGLVYNQTIRVLSYAIIALIVPRGNPANITGLKDLAEKNVKIGIADPAVAPFGRKAVELLVKNSIYDKVKDKLVIYGDVGQVARQVALGLVDVAILPHIMHYVYRNETEIIWLEPAQLPRISCQMIAVLNTTRNYGEAVKFEDFLVEYVKSSKDAQDMGYIADLSIISNITPYRQTELELEDICMPRG